jgi:ABC-type dipeptide/oligopeptide/nickel transport system permease component
MIKYFAGRIARAVPILVALATLNFLLIHLAPGDPISFLVGDSGADEQRIAALRQELGLDRPLLEQLVRYLRELATGDFGESLYFRRPVLELLMSRLPNTLLLTGTQLIIAAGIGIPLGVLAARRRNSATDNAISFFALAGFSIPVFWSAQVTIMIFAVNLGILPAQGMTSVRAEYEGFEHVKDVLWHLILPALTLAVLNMALIVRITRASMIEVLPRDYVVTARAKGLNEGNVVWSHAFRNGLLPVTTIIGLEVGTILAGTVVTETVFGWPGVGRLIFESIVRRDYPVIMGGFLFAGAGVILANLLTDMAYGVLDPRIRLRRTNV